MFLTLPGAHISVTFRLQCKQFCSYCISVYRGGLGGFFDFFIFYWKPFTCVCSDRNYLCHGTQGSVLFSPLLFLSWPKQKVRKAEAPKPRCSSSHLEITGETHKFQILDLRFWRFLIEILPKEMHPWDLHHAWI